jgi:MarR family transcriptional regulator, organic hydroperoxide resistance regulator
METDSRSISLIKILKQIRDEIKGSIEREFSEMNLTGPQGMIVGILAHDGEMKISDLSSKMGLSVSTISGIIDRLEGQGFVERMRNREDRRVVSVRVTPEFRKRAERHFAEIEKRLDLIINRGTPEEMQTVFKGLEILERLLNREEKKEQGSI